MKKTFTLFLLAIAGLGSRAQVGIGTNAPLTGFHVLDSNVLFSKAGDVPASPKSFPVVPEGRRMLWYPEKAAFRAGYVGGFGATYWNTANVGNYSFAVGNNTRATGSTSFAAGLTTTASGSESVALGNNGTASGERSFAFNGYATAVGAVAIGTGAQATNDDAVALGISSIASGLGSVTIGPSIARGSFAIAIGLQNSARGNFSTAIGKNARVNHQGSMVLGDAAAGFSSDSVYSSLHNQMTMRFVGGVRIFTSQNLTSGVQVLPGGGSWSSVSDRNKKENFSTVDKEVLLGKVAKLDITRWNYKSQPASQQHIGPMAQDFHKAFGLDGVTNDTTINTVDIDGVNMVAIQALEIRTGKLQQENKELKEQLSQLSERLMRLEAEKGRSAGRKKRNRSKGVEGSIAGVAANVVREEK
ncbi:tail fiber domain-containing protein [Pedobacter ureilyticus]|uniref:Tail fiber domain-containing protein n=1 Tax=Pedobacter ureilyticus TaxID=1393051 RepID=A0ABW9JBR3_9SPHI|nr:tail fiber domain-containing protein [Pedobacter helvus]